MHPDLFKEFTDEPVHLHVEGAFRDISIQSLPTLAALHFSPNCTSTTKMARASHPRREEHGYVGVNSSEAAKDWDLDVDYFSRLIKDQRSRVDGRGKVGFTLEQPVTERARKHHHIITLELPCENGGCGAKRYTVDICQVGAPQKKSTDFWVGGLDALVDMLRVKVDGQWKDRYLCPGTSAWHVHVPVQATHAQPGIKTASSVRFWPGLVSLLSNGISAGITANMQQASLD